jgi:phospholipase C
MRNRNLQLLPLLEGGLPPLSRRTFLSGASGAALAGCLPKADDSAAPVMPGTIEHVIFIMMENRSFDHMMGSRALLEGAAVDGLTNGMANTGSDGTVYPIAPSTVSCLPSPPHSWTSSHTQFDEGANTGFVTEYEDHGADTPGEVMGYMTRVELPVSYALADQFCLCEQWFCAVLGPTWPNRMFGHAGTSDGQKDNSFPEGGGFTFPTIWTHLDAIGVPWKYYYFDLPFIGIFDGHLKNGFHGFLEDFIQDCEKGDLPPVVWVDPGFTYNDDHPPHHVSLGQEFIAAVFDAIGRSALWEKCLVVLTYDEHGGFFDHVAPPTCEDDNSDDGFDQLGFRVPTLVVGPWVKQGVSSEVYNHASWLKYLCEIHAIEPWTTRIATSNSIALCIDEDRMARNEPLPPPVIPGLEFVDEDALGSECFGGGLGPTAPPSESADAAWTPPASAQRELEAFIRSRMPQHDGTASGRERLRMIRRRLRA